MKLLVFLMLAAILKVGASQIATTTYGAVRGTTLLSRNGREIAGFMGIPFAKSTEGNLRFKSPQPPEKWTGIRDASSYGPVCPQYSMPETNSTGDENCLTINVFTHTMNLKNDTMKKDLLPVLVYIHGGYFMVLSGSNYGPRYLLDHDVVLVTFNYRLGIFGFLGIPDEDSDAPGNAGMKDQVLALKWVQENIKNFGGDASRVTIYGESAGGAAVHYHLLSNQSKGLFSAAISGSGTAFKVYSHQVSPIKAAEKIANEVGCAASIGNFSEMVSCLRSTNSSIIASISDEYTKILKDPLRTFSPSTELHGDPNAFITQHPYEILENGLQQAVPWMVGVNSGEGFQTTLQIYASDQWKREINNNWMNGLAHEFLVYNESDSELITFINEFYLNSSATNGSIDFEKNFLGFTNLLSDRMYIYASTEAARIQANYSPVYLYYNDYITSVNPIGLGTIHGEELALIFSPANLSDPIIDQNHPDYEQSRAMVDIWVQFVTNPYDVRVNDRVWNPMSPHENSPNCLVLKNPNRGEQGVTKLPPEVINRMNFWKAHGARPYQDYQF